jgi:RNA polymerase sigma-70 factor (ECF subfamily)
MADPERFSDLLTTEVQGLAWRCCCRLSATTQDAEDLLQESLADAASRLRQLRDESSFRAWLLAIVRRRYLMLLRRRKLATVELDDSAQPWGVSGTSSESVELALLLQQLPVEQRHLLCLHYLEGFPAEELALALGVSRAGVEQRLFRARAALRRLYRGSPAASEHPCKEPSNVP